jgi:hypothetical protein
MPAIIVLPLWAEWLKILAPIFAVLATAGAVFVSVLTFRLSRQIAQWQASVARAQLRQNAYDRRFKIYETAKTLLVAYQSNGRLSTDDYIAYRRGTADAVFLLDDSVIVYLGQLQERAERALLLYNLIKARASGENSYHSHVDEVAQIEQWLLRQFPVLIAQFKPSMRLDEP